MKPLYTAWGPFLLAGIYAMSLPDMLPFQLGANRKSRTSHWYLQLCSGVLVDDLVSKCIQLNYFETQDKTMKGMKLNKKERSDIFSYIIDLFSVQKHGMVVRNDLKSHLDVRMLKFQTGFHGRL